MPDTVQPSGRLALNIMQFCQEFKGSLFAADIGITNNRALVDKLFEVHMDYDSSLCLRCR